MFGWTFVEILFLIFVPNPHQNSDSSKKQRNLCKSFFVIHNQCIPLEFLIFGIGLPIILLLKILHWWKKYDISNLLEGHVQKVSVSVILG